MLDCAAAVWVDSTFLREDGCGSHESVLVDLELCRGRVEIEHVPVTGAVHVVITKSI